MQLQTQKVKVQMMDDLSELIFLTRQFLERFAITIEQPYATTAVEKKIVLGSMTKYGKVDEDFATNLVTWSEVIRKTFFDGGIDELISTRRLDHISHIRNLWR